MIDKGALDRYITGNWGEDQFRNAECLCAGCGAMVMPYSDLPQVYRLGESGLCPECTLDAKDMGFHPEEVVEGLAEQS